MGRGRLTVLLRGGQSPESAPPHWEGVSPGSNDRGSDPVQALQGVELVLTSLLFPSVRVCSSVALGINLVGSYEDILNTGGSGGESW